MATHWGNFTNYNPNHLPGSPPSQHVRDVRLLLVENLVHGFSFKDKRCLDIGCNDGTVACHLAFDFGARSVVGVDVDPNLVSKANDLLALRSSRVRPPMGNAEPTVNYFPISAVLRHGRIPPSAPSLSKWPHVAFIAADAVLSADPAFSSPYDVILALSVIKWLHLEHLDDGLITFFQRCASSLASGGYLIIELQNWDSYEKAVRPNAAPHFAESLKKLKYRPETSFNELLQREGLNLCATSEQLRRRISLYRKR